MLQSSIYPESYRVPSEFFFVIKIQFIPQGLTEPVKLKKVQLKILDTQKSNSESKQSEVTIDRILKDKQKQPGILMNHDSQNLEHNILLYVENLKAKVMGHLEYSTLAKPDEILKVEIKEFFLDIGRKEQHIIKNHTFKEFWNSVKEVE